MLIRGKDSNIAKAFQLLRAPVLTQRYLENIERHVLRTLQHASRGLNSSRDIFELDQIVGTRTSTRYSEACQGQFRGREMPTMECSVGWSRVGGVACWGAHTR